MIEFYHAIVRTSGPRKGHHPYAIPLLKSRVSSPKNYSNYFKLLPKYTLMDGPSTISDLSSRRLREAVKYVSRAWLPVNQVTLKHAISMLKGEGVDRQNVLNEIKTDLALYSFLLKRLGGLSAEGEWEALPPHEIFLRLSAEQCLDLFSVQQSEFSVHDLANVKNVQLSQVRRTLISCSTAEILASKTEIDPDLAFGCAIARQLGPLLVAWNYQSSVIRAQQASESGATTFDAELQKLLGFTPEALGFELITSWCKSPAFLQGIGLKAMAEGLPMHGEALTQGREVLKFCKIGESLAKVSEPDLYPNAMRDWLVVGKDLDRVLGARGPELIKSRIDQLFPHYVDLAPQLFNKDISPEKLAKQSNLEFCRKLLNENQYINKCKPELKKLFASVYEKVLQHEASMAAVSDLVANVIPKTGFINGCIYLLDSKKMILVPRLKIGENNLTAYKPVSCSCGGEKAHPVSEAFHCSFPFRQERVILNGEIVSHITGKFGSNDKIGVLHLEFNDEGLTEASSDDKLTCFKALRQALGDSLALR